MLIVFFIITDNLGLVPIVLLSILIHELAHIIILHFSGNHIEKISFDITGISIIGKTYWKIPLHEIFLHLAGPLANIIIGFIFTTIIHNYEIFAAINIVMGVFNLLPFGNLDGGNILRILLYNSISIDDTDKILKYIDIILSIIVLILGLSIFKNSKTNFTLIILAIMMIRTLNK